MRLKSRIKQIRTGLIAGISACFGLLAETPPALAQANSWSYVPVDPNTVTYDLLRSAEKKVFLDTGELLWATLDPYVESDRRANVRNDECFYPPSGSTTDVPLERGGTGIRQVSLLPAYFEFSADWVERYLPIGRDNNRFTPPPPSINLPRFQSYGKTWTGNRLVFCHSRSGSDAPGPTVFQYAVGSWEQVDYSGWLQERTILVNPKRWNAISNNEFAKAFHAGLGLLRQADHERYGDVSAEGNQTQEWMGAMGLLPAIAMIEADGIAPTDRGNFADVKSRAFFMPMELNQPFTDYRSFNTPETSVDESRFSATALWWTFFQVYMDGAPSAFADEIDSLLLSRRAGDNALMDFDRLIASLASQSGDGLQFFIPQFAAVYANWPVTLFEPGKVDEETWLQESFGGCEKLSVSERTVYTSLTLEIEEDTSHCVEFEIRSDLQAFTGTYHVKLYGEPDLIDAIFMAGAMLKTDEELRCDVSMIRDGDCMVSFLQADLDDGQKARFTSGDYVEPNPGDASLNRSIISRVPSPGQPRGEAGSTVSNTLEIVFVLEVASIDSPLPVSGNWSTLYAGKAGPAPVGPFGDSETATASAAIFDRSMGTDRSVLESAANAGGVMIGMSNEDGDEITFIPDDRSVLAGKRTGTFDARAGLSLASGDMTVLQDPDKPSVLTILEHSEFSLRFEGTGNFCFIRESDREARQAEFLSRSAAAGMIDDLEAREAAFRQIETDLKLDDPCGAAYMRAPVKISGAVPFPESWTKDGMLTTWETETYLRLRNLRASKIRRLMSGGGRLSTSSGASGGSAGGGNGGGSSGPSGGAGTGVGSCSAPIYSDAEGCSCSCESLRCLEEKTAIGSAQPQEKGCRLFCGGAWAACQP